MNLKLCQFSDLHVNIYQACSCLYILHICLVNILFRLIIFSFKVATHEGTGRRDRSQGRKSHRVNRPIFVKNPVAGTEFWSPKSVPRIQTGLNSWDQSQGLVPAIFCLVSRVNRVVGLVPATN